MKKLVLCSLVVFSVLTLAFFSLPKPKNYIVLNKPITYDVVNNLYSNILRLHDALPIEEEIIIYFNSPGGLSVPVLTLLERIDNLKKTGRGFVGIIYGGCFSACGSIFASMNTRFMTQDAIYMQHATRGPNAKFPDRLDIIIDIARLRSDAEMLNKDVGWLINYFYDGDFVANADYMLKYKHIEAIVPQPKIEEI